MGEEKCLLQRRRRHGERFLAQGPAVLADLDHDLAVAISRPRPPQRHAEVRLRAQEHPRRALDLRQRQGIGRRGAAGAGHQHVDPDPEVVRDSNRIAGAVIDAVRHQQHAVDGSPQGQLIAARGFQAFGQARGGAGRLQAAQAVLRRHGGGVEGEPGRLKTLAEHPTQIARSQPAGDFLPARGPGSHFEGHAGGAIHEDDQFRQLRFSP